MASSLRVFEVTPSRSWGPPIPPRPEDDILATRGLRHLWPMSIVVFVALLVGVAAVSTTWGSSVRDAQAAAVQDLLGGPRDLRPEWIGDSALGVEALWSNHPSLGSTIPLIPRVSGDDELDVVEDGTGWWVSPREGGALFELGTNRILAASVRDAAGTPAIDLGRSLLREHSRRLGTTESGPSAPARVATADEAARAYLSALVGRDASRLAGIVATSPESPVLDYPNTFLALTGGTSRYVVTSADLVRGPDGPDGEVTLTVESIAARNLDGAPIEMSLVNGCVAFGSIDASGGDSDCSLRGLANLGRPLPLQIIVRQHESGWYVDHNAVDALAWRHVVAGGGTQGLDHLEGALRRWGLLPLPDPGEAIPLIDGALGGDGETAPEAAPATPTSTPETPSAQPGEPAAILSSVPAGAQQVAELSGRFSAARLAEMGMVGLAENLIDFGYVDGAGIAWSEGDRGAFMLVMRFDSATAARREFLVYHSAAASQDGEVLIASYGPGDFTGPTDRGSGVGQYRVVLLAGPDHILVETWGAGSDLEPRAASLLTSAGF